MSIANKLSKLETDITNAYTAIDTKGGTIPQNKNTENLADAIDSIQTGGGDLSEYFNNKLGAGYNNQYGVISGFSTDTIKKVPNNLVAYPNLEFAFYGTGFREIPMIDTSKTTNMNRMFMNCFMLQTIPVFNTSKVSDMWNMFLRCGNLSNDSLNNILAMCANATSYTKTKTLQYIGITSTQATTCQGLSNYQAFLDAGWTTGY